MTSFLILQAAKERLHTHKQKTAGVDLSSSDEAGGVTPEKPKRTRSKMRTNKPPPPSLAVGSSDSDGPKSTESESDTGTFKTPEPVRKNTRSKMRKAKVCGLNIMRFCFLFLLFF